MQSCDPRQDPNPRPCDLDCPCDSDCAFYVKDVLWAGIHVQLNVHSICWRASTADYGKSRPEAIAWQGIKTLTDKHEADCALRVVQVILSILGTQREYQCALLLVLCSQIPYESVLVASSVYTCLLDYQTFIHKHAGARTNTHTRNNISTDLRKQSTCKLPYKQAATQLHSRKRSNLPFPPSGFIVSATPLHCPCYPSAGDYLMSNPTLHSVQNSHLRQSQRFPRKACQDHCTSLSCPVVHSPERDSLFITGIFLLVLEEPTTVLVTGISS